MRRFVEQADRGQSTLLPECLDDFIDNSNPVRVTLDLAEMNFEGGERVWKIGIFSGFLVCSRTLMATGLFGPLVADFEKRSGLFCLLPREQKGGHAAS